MGIGDIGGRGGERTRKAKGEYSRVLFHRLPAGSSSQRRWGEATDEPSRCCFCLGELALARSDDSPVVSYHQLTLAGLVPPRGVLASIVPLIARGLFEPASVGRGYRRAFPMLLLLGGARAGALG